MYTVHIFSFLFTFTDYNIQTKLIRITNITLRMSLKTGVGVGKMGVKQNKKQNGDGRRTETVGNIFLSTFA